MRFKRNKTIAGLLEERVGRTIEAEMVQRT